MSSLHGRRFLQSLTVLAAVCLASCAKDVPYKPGSVRTAALARNVQLPPAMTFETRGSALAAGAGAGLGGIGGGIVGASIAGEMAARRDVEMSEWFRQEVLKVLEEEITARRQFHVVPEGQGQATIQVKVPKWGFMLNGLTALFSGQAAALMMLNVDMKDAGGRRLWYAWTMASPQNPNAPDKILSHSTSELESSPALMRQHLSACARRAARQIAGSIPMGNAR